MTDSGGFTTSRNMGGTAERVYAAFVEPAKLEQWFVVDGYHTPADRMRVDAVPGGRMDAVMISDADGSEIPFGFEYTELEPPQRLVMTFQQPDEVVTITILEQDNGSVDVTYFFERTPAPTDDAVEFARKGADDMLGRIAAGVERGSI